MQVFEFNKIIRAKIIDNMISQGVIVKSKKLSNSESLQALKNKLFEETREVMASKNVHEMTQEIADVLDVLQTMAEHNQISWTKIQKALADKRQEKGLLDAFHLVEHIELDNSNPQHADYIEYFTQNAHKYRKICS